MLFKCFLYIFSGDPVRAVSISSKDETVNLALQLTVKNTSQRFDHK